MNINNIYFSELDIMIDKIYKYVSCPCFYISIFILNYQGTFNLSDILFLNLYN